MGDFTMHRVLTPEEMGRADALTIASGLHSGSGLMERAADAVVAEVLRRYPEAAGFDVLCGVGNNGGDGYAAATRLRQAGADVAVWALGSLRPGSDAEEAARGWPGQGKPLDAFAPRPGRLVIDALFGAGLNRPLEGAAARAATLCREFGSKVVAVDLPSGIFGRDGRADGICFAADLTVTFFRLKPGHLLLPGRDLCGEIVVADIGIPDAVLTDIDPRIFANGPALWHDVFPTPATTTHKYARGHAAVLSGGPTSSGAARLSAMAAARTGAGAVTLLSPPAALQVNANHLTSIMLHLLDDDASLKAFLRERKVRSLVAGPGFGVGERLRQTVLALLGMADAPALVIDADAITSLATQPEIFFAAVGRSAAPVVLTPHEGEFGRLFPDLAQDRSLSKLDRARQAAARANSILVLKGADTVIAHPDGRAAINANGTSWLATAGSGDVLCGIVAGLLAQEMPGWEAACAAVWIHAEAGRAFGPGLIAEDLPGLLPQILHELIAEYL